MSRNPLFDVMLVMQNNESVDIALGGSEAEGANVESTIAKFDMTFNVIDNNGNYAIGFEYCTDLFKAETAKELLKHLEEVLRTVTKNADQKIGDIEMVTLQDERLWKEYNKTEEEHDEALDALIALGFPLKEASEALSKVDVELPVEERVRLALKK